MLNAIIGVYLVENNYIVYKGYISTLCNDCRNKEKGKSEEDFDNINKKLEEMKKRSEEFEQNKGENNG